MEIRITDFSGSTLIQSQLETGAYKYNMELGNLPSGIYLIHYNSAEINQIQKLIIHH